MKLNSLIVTTKSNKLIILIFIVFVTQLQIDAQVRGSEGNYTPSSTITQNMMIIDRLILDTTNIKVDHADYYWLRNNTEVEHEQKFSLGIIKSDPTIKSITVKINNILLEVNKMTSNRKWMEDSNLRNILWDILTNIERLMDNLEILGEQRMAPK